MLTEHDEERAELFARKLAETLQQARSVSDSEHYDHHRWITMQIRKEEARAKFWEEMIKHVARWGILAVVSSTFLALWLGAKIILKLPL